MDSLSDHVVCKYLGKDITIYVPKGEMVQESVLENVEPIPITNSLFNLIGITGSKAEGTSRAISIFDPLGPSVPEWNEARPTPLGSTQKSHISSTSNHTSQHFNSGHNSPSSSPAPQPFFRIPQLGSSNWSNRPSASSSQQRREPGCFSWLLTP